MARFSARMKDIQSPEFKPTRLAATLVCIYVVLSMCSNIMSVRTVLIFGLAVDAGTILYPFIFVVRDFTHRKTGRRTADLAVILSFICCLFMFLCFALAAALPPDLRVGPQEEFGQVLLPGFRIVAGSLLAALIAELIDGGIYSAIAAKKGNLTAAMVVSNVITVPIDSLIFTTVAFAGRVPAASFFSILLMNIIIKYLVIVIFIPLSRRLSKKENLKHSS